MFVLPWAFVRRPMLAACRVPTCVLVKEYYCRTYACAGGASRVGGVGCCWLCSLVDATNALNSVAAPGVHVGLTVNGRFFPLTPDNTNIAAVCTCGCTALYFVFLSESCPGCVYWPCRSRCMVAPVLHTYIRSTDPMIILELFSLLLTGTTTRVDGVQFPILSTSTSWETRP